MSVSVTPVISVVVPCYNVASEVTALLSCLATQNFDQPWEIVFADNRSTDDTVSVIEQFDGELPPYKIVSAPDIAGAGYARNVGVDQCDAPYIAFCDGDDEIPQDWVRKMYAAVAEYGFVGCRIEETAFTKKKFAGLMGGDVGGSYSLGFLPFTGAGAMGIRKDIFQEVGGFNSHLRYCEDIDLCYRVQLSGHALYVDSSNKIFYKARETEWALLKQRFKWGRYEKVITIRYKDHGHDQTLVQGGALRSLVKCGVIWVLRCYDPQKRLRYGKLVCKALASLLPPLKEAELPVQIHKSQLDPSVIAESTSAERLELVVSA